MQKKSSKKCSGPVLKPKILSLLSQNRTPAFIARDLSCSVQYVRRIAKELLHPTNKKIGRPKIQSPKIYRAIRYLSHSPRLPSLNEMKAKLSCKGIQISPQTIARILRDHHFKPFSPQKKSFKSKLHKEKRLEFCKAHIDDNFDSLIFSDETAVELLPKGPHPRKGAKDWQKKSSDVRHIPTRRNRKIQIWAAISKTKNFKLVFLPKALDKEIYHHILTRFVAPAATKKSQRVFQQDNATPHTAKINKLLLEEKTNFWTNYPPNSPDLNPIENIWALLKKEFAKHQPGTVRRAKLILNQIWENDPELNKAKINVIDSERKRMKAVIDAKGGDTKY